MFNPNLYLHLAFGIALTIFVDQHIPLHDLTVECDERLKAMLPGDTTMEEDLVKFRELFTF